MRVCKTCGVEKLLSCFPVAKKCHGGRSPKCKACYKQGGLDRLAQRSPPIVPESKFCTGCETTKLSSEFYPRASSHDGLRVQCKACDSKSAKRWRSNNHERHLAYAKTYYQENTEACRARNAKWCKENRTPEWYSECYRANAEEYRARSHRKYWKDPAAANEESRLWRRRNPEIVRGYTHARRARKRGAGGSFTTQDIKRIFNAQRGRCACCRSRLGKNFHRDHIKPIVKGGTNNARNIQLLCSDCNQRKHAKDPIIFMQEMGRLL